MQKNRIIFIVLCFLFILSTVTISVSAEEKTDIKKGVAVIDGVIDEIWDKVEANPINKINPNTGEDSGTTGYWKGLWSGNDLYILIVVTDANIVTMNANQDDENRLPNAGDGVEIYLDVLNEKGDAYENVGELHYGMFTTGQVHIFDNGVADIDMLSQNSKASVNGNQIIYEFKMPLDIISGGRLPSVSAGHKVGLDVQICDSDTGTDWRIAAYNWSDDEDLAWKAPSYFGTITLIDVEAVPAAEEVEEPEVQPAPQEEQAPPATDAPAATVIVPQTGDAGIYLLLILAAVAACGAVALGKKRKADKY